MGTSPIGDSLDPDKNQPAEENTQHHRHERLPDDDMRNYPPDAADPSMQPKNLRKERPPAPDFMSDLLDGQHELIDAQHAFIRDGDIQAMIRAQHIFLYVQGTVLERLGVFGR